MDRKSEGGAEWRTTKTHSHEAMAECYRQLFFCFGQPMLRRGDGAANNTATPVNPMSISSNLRSAADLDALFARHCAVVGAIAEDSVMKGSSSDPSSDAVAEAAAAMDRLSTAGAAHVPVPSMLCGTVYDAPASSSGNGKDDANNKKGKPSLPQALVAHLPYSFVEAVFKTFGQLDYFHFEPERGVGTVIYRSGMDGEVCYITKHLTSMVVPSIAHMRGETMPAAGDGSKPNIDDVFGDEIKSKSSSSSSDTLSAAELPQLVPVVLYLEFASFLPFFNPCLVANASDGSGISRHLLRTFPVPYSEEGEEKEGDTDSKKDDEKKKPAKSNEDWQLKPFMKVTGAAGEPSLPFQKVWTDAIDGPTREDGEEGKEEDDAEEEPKGAAAFASLQRLVLEELLATRSLPSFIPTAAPANSTSDEGETESKKNTVSVRPPQLPPGLTVMDAWVAYACRFVLWKPTYPSALLATAGVFANNKTTNGGNSNADAYGGDDEDDEDEALYQRAIDDGSRAVLALALRGTTTIGDVLRMLVPVCLHKFAPAVEQYLSPNNKSTPSALQVAKSRVAGGLTRYGPPTRRGMNLRRRLAFSGGYSVGHGGILSKDSVPSSEEGNAKKKANNDNIVLQRLRTFHFDELIAVHYPALADAKRRREEKKQKAKASAASASSEGATTVIVAEDPLGSGEEPFFALCRRLVENETLHCAMASFQYRLRAQNDGALAYWWLELKLRKIASVQATLEFNRATAAKKKDKTNDTANAVKPSSSPVASVWALHTATADYTTQMGLEDPAAVAFFAASSVVQLALNTIDNAFLLANMAAHPSGLPDRLLLQQRIGSDGGASAAATTNKEEKDDGSSSPFASGAGAETHSHLPAAQFPDVLNMTEEHAMSGSANSLYAIALPPAWFVDPYGGGAAAAAASPSSSASPLRAAVGACGLGASLLAQQQRYAGPLGMLVMVFEALAGPLRVPLIASWLIGLVALLAVWGAGH